MQDLPDKPSELIRLAIKDLKEVENDDKYVIDMNYYVARSYQTLPVSKDKTCYVCLAGSVMVKTLREKVEPLIESWPDREIAPFILGRSIGKKLEALDSFRYGAISGTLLKYFDITNCKIANRDICDYGEDPVKFKEDMLAVAYDLEKIGL